ncbi:MAG: c-type cytochrome biogenesis protein CcmI [Gammaproteobacteria bacterium]
MIFALASGALVLIVIGIFYYVLSRREITASPAESASKALYERRVEELAQDITSGEMLPDLAQAAEQDIVRVTLDDEKQVAVRQLTNAPVLPSALIALVIVVAVSGATYFSVGDLQRALGREPAPATAQTLDEESIRQAIEGLKDQLNTDPDNAEGWMLLGRTMMALGEYEQAVISLKKAMALVPNAPGLMLQYADAIAMSAGGKLTEEAQQIVRDVLAIEPDNVSALWLAGLGAAERDDNIQALAYLSRARELTAAAGAPTQELDQVIARLNPDDQALDQSAQFTQGENSSASSSTDLPAIPILIELKDEFADALDGDESLFVFARVVGQSGPPVAVRREDNVSFPFTTSLDQTMSMAPQFRLKNGQSIVVAARLSKSGQAMPQAGDLIGQAEAFNFPDQTPPSNSPLKITIDSTQR